MQILKTLPFSQMDLWDVKRLIKTSVLSKFDIVELGIYINERSEKIKLFNYPDKEFGILGVNNKIGLFDAYKEFGRNINQGYKIVENDDLIYNPYRINVGSIGLKTDKQKHKYISPAYVVFSCHNGLKAEYLYCVFKTDTFKIIIRENTTGSVRQNLKFETLAQIQIPFPPLEVQNRLVADYNAKIKLANEQEKKAKDIEQELEDYLIEVLGIVRLKEKEKKVLNFVDFSNLIIWGVDRLLRGNFNSVLTSSIYPNEKLNTLVYVNPRTDLTDLESEDVMSFIPMKYISDDYGVVLNTEQGKKANSKGYTKFKEGDLLWSRITPCMQNGKSAIVSDLLNGFGYGSTEYHVLREKEDNFKLDFLYHLLRTKLIRQDAINHFTGSAGQQRVPKTYLENLTVPVPPLKIQIQITNHISDLKQQIKDLQTQAKINRENAIKEFEQKIFKL